MKRIIFAFLVFALIFTFSAEATSPLEMDGYDWQEMTETEREHLAKGAIAGFNTFTIGLSYEFEKEEDSDVELKKIIKELNEKGEVLTEEVSSLVLTTIDEYYQNENNLENSLTQAFYIALREAEELE